MDYLVNLRFNRVGVGMLRGCFAASANRTFHIARSVLLCKKLKPIA